MTNIITVRANYRGQDLKDIPVINPGGWFGKTWLIEIGGSYSSTYLVVEAGSLCDAIDELADSEHHGHHIIVSDEDLGDYPEDSRHYGPHGQVLDLDHLMIYGDEGKDQPFVCRYFGNGLPADGVVPADIWEYDFDETSV